MKGNELYLYCTRWTELPLHGYIAPSREILFCYLRGLGSGILKTSDLTGAILVSLAKILLLRQAYPLRKTPGAFLVGACRCLIILMFFFWALTFFKWTTWCWKALVNLSCKCVVIRGPGLGGHCIFYCWGHRISSFGNITLACKVPNRQNAAKAGKRQEATSFPGVTRASLKKGALWLRKGIKKAKSVFHLCVHPLLVLSSSQLQLPRSVWSRGCLTSAPYGKEAGTACEGYSLFF